MRVAVIGAGPAGLTAGYQLCKANIPVTVFESESSVGGLAKTVPLWGQKVDLGPHRFLSRDRRVNELFLEVVQRDYAMINRLTRILYKRKFFHYPLRPAQALVKLGFMESARCVASYATSRLSPLPSDNSFENWVVNRFGRRLFELFFKSYSEKLWGISCQELDADFAAQRIKKLTLLEAVKNAVSVRQNHRHKTLADQFAYPLAGSGMVYERMADYINAHGGEVLCESPIRGLVVEKNRVCGVDLASGERHKFDHVISTMPITLLVDGLPDVPLAVRNCAQSLRYRNTIMVYLHLDGSNLFPDNWLYVHSPELRMGRVTNFRNWVPQLYADAKTSILVAEYWCQEDEALWTQDDGVLTDLAAGELRQTGLTNGAKLLGSQIYRLKRSYPIYDRNYKGRLQVVENFLSSVSGLSVIGRNGAFKYNNQDHSMLMGILAAENIHRGTSHNLWGINTDYDSYQEATVITETGLLQE